MEPPETSTKSKIQNPHPPLIDGCQQIGWVVDYDEWVDEAAGLLRILNAICRAFAPLYGL